MDWKIRNGSSSSFHNIAFPQITGIDAAGVVDSVGGGVTRWRPGDEVFGSAATGAVAEFAVLTEMARKPAQMAWTTAAALPSAAKTGLRAIDLLSVRDGEVVVINGVAGGVGLAAAQFALARGAFVIGTATLFKGDPLARGSARPGQRPPGTP